MKIVRGVICLILGLSCACGDEAGPTDSGEDAGAEDADFGDAGFTDASDADSGDTDAGRDASVGDGGANEWGFAVRVPTTHTVPCESMFWCGGSTTIEASDHDFVCTLGWQTWDHVLYIQASPVRYADIVAFEYETVGAWLSDGSTLREVTASYEWGGNHHNESILVDLPEQRFRYWHSSFGFGFRACQPPDCLEVYEPNSSTSVADGCAPERTIPAVCVEVQSDGTIPPLVDMFEKCPGDT